MYVVMSNTIIIISFTRLPQRDGYLPTFKFIVRMSLIEIRKYIPNMFSNIIL